MKRRHDTLGTMMTAILAAYLLVLQALVGGLAYGTHAGGMLALGAYGEVICQGASGGTGSPTDPAHHTPDCCTTGCNVSVGGGVPPVAAAFPAPRPIVVGALAPAELDLTRDGAPRRPHNARAPPLA